MRFSTYLFCHCDYKCVIFKAAVIKVGHGGNYLCAQCSHSDWLQMVGMTIEMATINPTALDAFLKAAFTSSSACCWVSMPFGLRCPSIKGMRTRRPSTLWKNNFTYQSLEYTILQCDIKEWVVGSYTGGMGWGVVGWGGVECREKRLTR